jgi:hypothetical protein
MYSQEALSTPTRQVIRKLRPARMDLFAVMGVVLVLVGVAAALFNFRSHGVACGNMFYESGRPLQADLAQLDTTHTYSPASSAVLDCAKARTVQTFLSLTMVFLGIATMALWLVLRSIKFNVTDRSASRSHVGGQQHRLP